MKISHCTRTALATIVIFPTATVAFAPVFPAPRQIQKQKTALFSKDIMSDMDLMCIANAADLCSYYDVCALDERDAILNRFEEQTDLLAERMAMMQSLSQHLRTGDHCHLEDEEVASVKRTILSSLSGLNAENGVNVDFLDGVEVSQLKDEIMSTMQAEAGVVMEGAKVRHEDNFLSAMQDEKDSGNFYDAWLGF